MDANERESFLFINLLFSLQMTAMQQMGKIKILPQIQLRETLMEQTTIDILEALRIKRLKIILMTKRRNFSQ